MDSDRTALEAAFGRAILPLARRWRKAADLTLSDLGLSHASGWVLIHIGRLGGDVPQSDLAAEADMRAPSLVPLIDRLEKDGLAVRRLDENDRRINRISLTKPGQALVSRIEQALQRIRKDMLIEIDDEALRTAVAVMQKVDRTILAGEEPAA